MTYLTNEFAVFTARVCQHSLFLVYISIPPKDMNIRRHARKKPWIAKKQGRNRRKLNTDELIKPFANSTSSAFYKTTTWRAVRETVLNRDGLCVWCLNEARATPANEADHVVPLERCAEYDIDPHDPSNIVGSCRSCNSRRAAYTARGVFFETLEGWQKYLRKKYIEKLQK